MQTNRGDPDEIAPVFVSTFAPGLWMEIWMILFQRPPPPPPAGQQHNYRRDEQRTDGDPLHDVH